MKNFMNSIKDILKMASNSKSGLLQDIGISDPALIAEVQRIIILYVNDKQMSNLDK